MLPAFVLHYGLHSSQWRFNSMAAGTTILVCLLFVWRSQFITLWPPYRKRVESHQNSFSGAAIQRCCMYTQLYLLWTVRTRAWQGDTGCWFLIYGGHLEEDSSTSGSTQKQTMGYHLRVELNHRECRAAVSSNSPASLHLFPLMQQFPNYGWGLISGLRPDFFGVAKLTKQIKLCASRVNKSCYLGRGYCCPITKMALRSVLKWLLEKLEVEFEYREWLPNASAAHAEAQRGQLSGSLPNEGLSPIPFWNCSDLKTNRYKGVGVRARPPTHSHTLGNTVVNHSENVLTKQKEANWVM